MELNEKTINKLAEYIDYNFKSGINLINISQELLHFDTNFFPIKSADLNDLENLLKKQIHYDPQKELVNNILQMNRSSVNVCLPNDNSTFSKRNLTVVQSNEKSIISALKTDQKSVYFTFNSLTSQHNSIIHAKHDCIQLTFYFDKIDSNSIDLNNAFSLLITPNTKIDIILKAFHNQISKIEKQYSIDIRQLKHNFRCYYSAYYTPNFAKFFNKLDVNFLLHFNIILQNIFKHMTADEFYQLRIRDVLILSKNPSKINRDDYSDTIPECNTFKQLVMDLRSNFLVQTSQINEHINFYTENLTLIKQLEAYYVLGQLLYSQSHNLSMNDDLTEAVISMIYEQSKNYHPVKQNKKQIIQQFKFDSIMTQFLINYHTQTPIISDDLKFTLLDFVNYTKALHQHLPIDSKMFNIIMHQDDYDTVKYDQAAQLHIGGKLKIASLTEKQKLLQLMPNSIVKKLASQMIIYKILENTELEHYPNHKLLVHGTNDFSVLSILGNGLLTNKQLTTNYDSYNYSITGQGLGNGIYFAQLDQIQKSLNYARGRDSYLFICDVGYHQIKKTTYYQNVHCHKQEDLVLGYNVGSHNRNEWVAKSNQQVALRYLIKIKGY